MKSTRNQSRKGTDAVASDTPARSAPRQPIERMHLHTPRVYAFDDWVAKNRIQQLAALASVAEGTVANFSRGRLSGYLITPSDGGAPILVLPRKSKVLENHDLVLTGTIDASEPIQNPADARWLKHPLLPTIVGKPAEEHQGVLDSWRGAFRYSEDDGPPGRVALRPPQIGAIHAAHAHWAISNDVATIVMPTGTGKTETMLSILVSARCNKVLVVVPTDALRAQLADKFITLGALKLPQSDILDAKARFPFVCTLGHIPHTADEVDKIFALAQVIVTTSSIAARAEEAVARRIASHCSHLFIDEAHHAEAPTWSRFKSYFKDSRVLQFTATPFREDGHLLDGKIIFRYPLRRAQQEGYFKPIRFRGVVAFERSKADQAIATEALKQLRADAGKKHVLMARVDSVARAGEVFRLYERHKEFNPVELHSGISTTEREERRKMVLSGESKIVVCVDMLGEGFDLPELKIAAFHDIRKSLAVTLQLAGRFTRSRPDLGDATFIANTADTHVSEELQKLYAQDPDWNVLLPEISERLVDNQVSLQEFLNGFSEFAAELPLKSIQPANSTVVFKTSCSAWHPEEFRDGIPGLGACEQVYHSINEAKKTLVVVTARRAQVPWTDAAGIFALHWALYVVHWSPDAGLLFINSSDNAGEYKALAAAITDENSALVNGDAVFRAFAGITRLHLQNVGLTEQLGRNIRYTGRMGSDVESGLSDAQRRRARKSVLSGAGFEGGRRVSIGVSRRGRIWSHRRERLDQLIDWCGRIGAKLLDETINPDAVLRGTLESEHLTSRPAKVPIAVDWPEDIYEVQEGRWVIVVDGQAIGIDEVELDVRSHDAAGPLQFIVSATGFQRVITLELSKRNENSVFKFSADQPISIRRRDAKDDQTLPDFFDEYPPVIWFADGSSLTGDEYVPLKTIPLPYNPSKIQAWDWSGIDLRKESQGEQKQMDTVQARVIRELKGRNYNLIIDDDGSGEAADVVAIRVVLAGSAPRAIEVEFYHCKFSKEDTPGARVGDLYEVCGQAQKSVCWKLSSLKEVDLFTHLLKRADDTEHRNRYEAGTAEDLHTIRAMSQICEVKLSIFIVQPGLSKAKVSPAQLELLSVTENYLLETYQLPFGVIASA